MDPAKWSSPDARYLGLTGVVIASEAYRTRTHPEFEALKQEFFPHDPDYPVILVRNRITKKLGPFGPLSNPEHAELWEQRITRFLTEHISQTFTVAIDKQELWNRYGHTATHPYNHCATALTEKYALWLRSVGAEGDVLGESRGSREDRELRRAFREFMNLGTESLPATALQRIVTDTEIKLRPKEANITGLQLADLIVYPATRDMLREHGLLIHRHLSQATQRLIEAIRPMHGENGMLLLP